MSPKSDVQEKTTTQNLDKESSQRSSSPADREALAARFTQWERNLTPAQALRKYWRAVLWIFYGQLVVFGFGIDGIIAANILAIPRFRQDYGYRYEAGSQVSYIISAAWLSAFNGVAQLTAIIGALATGVLADRIGRRWTNLVFCIISIGGVAAQFWSDGSLAVLCVGKGINGFSIGAWLIIGPLYASEVAPLPLRGILASVTNVVQFSGVLVFTGVVYCVGPRSDASSYRIPFACQWIIPALVTLTVWFWPESPVWLVRQGRIRAAEHAQRRLYGTDDRIDKRGMLAQIEVTLAAEDKQQNATYLECFQRRQRSRTLICMFVYACQYLSGVIFVLGYQSYFYELTGYTAHQAFTLSMINNGLQYVAIIGSWFLLATMGSRFLIVWGQLCGAVCLFVIGGASTAGTQSANIAAVAFIFIWSFTYMLTLSTAAWTVPALIPALRFRARTQGLSNMSMCFVQWLIGFTFPYMFNPDSGNLRGKVGFIFGATTLVGFIGVYFFLPEVKSRSVAEIDTLYKMGVSARRFKSTRLDQTQPIHRTA